MKRGFKAAAAAVTLLFLISVGLNISYAVSKGAEPGSEQDPIVSKSYVDAAISQLSSKIQALTEQNGQLASKLAEQEKTIKALQSGLDLAKSGKTSGTSGSGTSGNTGTGNTGAGSGGTGSGNTGAGGTGGTAGTGNGSGKTESTAGKGIVKATVVNVRVQANTTSKIVVQVVKNEVLTLISKSGDWYKVKTSKGISGYVRQDLITVQK